MKNVVVLLIIASVFCSAFGAVATDNPSGKQLKEDISDTREFSHTVFAEDATATWCGYCHYAREALDTIYVSGDYPFFYTCMVDDKNTHAEARNVEYNTYGFPTVFFDGGYKVSVGGGTGNEGEYRNYIEQCGSRTVEDIDVLLTVDWLGDAVMDITASVVNNEATQYDGRLRVYVTEIESSFGWKDTTGHPYTFPFLDYAFNEVISIPTGDTWTDSIMWDGHDYNNGYGVNFGSIQYGNIAVIAVVFNSDWHQGYAYPPNQNPFDAYYVDDTVGVIVGAGPYTPSSPSPADGATNVDVNADLTWTGGGTPGYTITYDVYFGTSSTPPKVSSNQSSTSYNPGTMEFETTYYWKIVAWDDNGGTATGSVWHFTTRGNVPPNTPSNPNPQDGATSVDINADLLWTGGDPDGDTVTYDVYFGTTSPPPKVSGNQSSSSYNPGTMNFVTTYYWKIVAWDPFDETAAGSIWDFTTRSNHAPNAPSSPNPQDSATDVDIHKQLSWTGGDPDPGDAVTYDVYFGTTSPPPKVASNQSGTTYNPGTMNFVTTYYWKIVSWDKYDATTAGPVWQFTTTDTPNTSPETPGITGTEDGKIGTSYEYTFTAIDSDDDDLYYTITWGDNTSEDWVGPISSGEELVFSHTWSEKGTYTIQAMVTDEHGAESDWGSLDVTMPTTTEYVPHPFFTLLEKILERFPHSFPLLRYLLGYL